MPGAPNWAVKYPLVNGHMYSHSSIELEVDGLHFAGVTNISYEDPTKPGKIYGTGGVLVGRTPGTNKPTMSMTMYRRDWDLFRQQLATGAGSAGNGSFGTKSFLAHVTYHEEPLPSAGAQLTPGVSPADPFDQGPSQAQTVTDTIEQVRVTGVAQASAEGGGATAVVLTCDPWKIRWGGHGPDGKDGLTNLADDAANGQRPSDGSAPDPAVNGPSAGATAGQFWYATEDGFEGADYMPNPWDTFVFAGTQIPGLCKVSATPGQAVDKQKPNGADAAALIIRGYTQAEIDVEITLWLPSHWKLWQDFVTKFWRHPGKSSVFEQPALKQPPPVDPLTGKPKKDPKTGQPIVVQDQAVLRERAAINRARPATRDQAADIYHPSLAGMRIGSAIITSISTPTPGSEPQSFVVKMKLVEYVPAPTPSQTKSVAQAVKGSTTDTTSVTPPLRKAGDPKIPYYVANTSAATPADTDAAPDATFTPPYAK